MCLHARAQYRAHYPRQPIPRSLQANGFQCFVITVATYLVAAYYLHAFDPTIVYDNYKSMMAICHVFSLIFCVFLLLKGLYFPSSTDSGTNGNIMMDYFWGTEL